MTRNTRNIDNNNSNTIDRSKIDYKYTKLVTVDDVTKSRYADIDVAKSIGGIQYFVWRWEHACTLQKVGMVVGQIIYWAFIAFAMWWVVQLAIICLDKIA